MDKYRTLLEYGQSYWLDNLSREMITNGELKKRIEKEGLRGITSNPKIFHGAISKGDFYDDQIKDLIKSIDEVGVIYENLAVKDIQNACDMLKRVYDSSDGVDGFVSLEVSPHLARETNETMEEARRLFNEVNRPNCFIKIPGTKEGVPAIEEMLYEGININITLLFSIESYEAVAKAYLNALERRINENKPVDKLRSVASFFLSRIDVLVDQKLKEEIIPGLKNEQQLIANNLLGESAIASAKIAYKRFKEIFSGERWEKLKAAGAKVQRPLWASTSNKNEAYSATRYVEPLIGRDTVNTMPDETIEAYREYGKIERDTVDRNLEHAFKVFEDLRKSGIDMDKITNQLVEEGIDKFIDPFDKLLGALEEKVNKMKQ